MQDLPFKPKPIKVPEQIAKRNWSLLDDDLSKTLYEQHTLMQKNGVYVNEFSQIDGHLSIYRHPVVRPQNDDTIYSICPHQGGPLRFFYQTTGGRCLVHCFEERVFMYRTVCQNIVRWHLENNVIPHCAAISARSGMVSLQNKGHSGPHNAGQVVSLDEVPMTEFNDAAYAYSIDDFVAQSGCPPTLIECGRAGFAMNIVEGAKETIATHLPRLILVDSPFVDILSRLRKLSDKYRFFYSECGRRRAGAFFAIADSQA